MMEMVELWPKSEDGMLSARLAQRHLMTLLVEKGAKATCLPELAASEMATCRALACLVKDFGTLPTTEKPPMNLPKLKPLKRFQSPPPEKSEPEKP